jgi:hypothetical protein
MSNEYEFVTISIKKDVAQQIDRICDDAKSYGIFISKSSLLRVMVFNPTIIEYSIKRLLNESSKES